MNPSKAAASQREAISYDKDQGTKLLTDEAFCYTLAKYFTADSRMLEGTGRKGTTFTGTFTHEYVMSDREKIAKDFMNRGFQRLSDDEFEEAEAIGRQLIEMRHSSGHEILALAQNGLDNMDEAIKTLEAGIKIAPNVWLLRQLLGNYYSDTKKYSEAQEQYEYALGCPYVEVDDVNYNRAIAFNRDGKPERALELIAGIEDIKFGVHLMGLEANCLLDMGRIDEANQAAEAFMFRWQSSIDEDGLPEYDAQVLAIKARAALKQGNPQTALNHAWEAISIDRMNEDAAWVIREVENDYSTNSVCFRILIDGEWPFYDEDEDEEQAAGFLASYDVVAESLEEALDFIRRFEPEEIRDKIRVDESEIISKAPDSPKGVYSVDPYALYIDDEDEDEP